jgi:hypothetical protein
LVENSSNVILEQPGRVRYLSADSVMVLGRIKLAFAAISDASRLEQKKKECSVLKSKATGSRPNRWHDLTRVYYRGWCCMVAVGIKQKGTENTCMFIFSTWGWKMHGVVDHVLE